MEATNTDTAQGGALNIVTDSWMSNVAGYEEVKQFHRKMGEKMGYLFGSGMASLGQMRPETLTGFEEVAKEMAKAAGGIHDEDGGSSNGNRFQCRVFRREPALAGADTTTAAKADVG